MNNDNFNNHGGYDDAYLISFSDPNRHLVIAQMLDDYQRDRSGEREGQGQENEEEREQVRTPVRVSGETSSTENSFDASPIIIVDSSRLGTTGDTVPTGKDPSIEGSGSNTTASPFQLNPKFQHESTEEVRNRLFQSLLLSDDGLSAAGDVHKELVARSDIRLSPTDARVAIESIGKLQDALDSGKPIKTDGFGSTPSSDRELTPEEKVNYFKAIAADLEAMDEQVRSRQDYAGYLRAVGRDTEANQLDIEAATLSERMPPDLLKRQANSAEDFAKTLDNGPLKEQFELYVKFLRDPDSGLARKR
jgi:hypothetical protein